MFRKLTGFAGRAAVPVLLGSSLMIGLGGCAAEMGRRVTDTDVSCLRAQMGTDVKLSFPLAANTCQRWTNHNLIIGEKNAKPIPFNLAGAPDLQAQAQEYGYSYTR